MEVSRISAKDLFNLELHRFQPNAIDTNLVKQIKRALYQHKSTFGNFILPGALIIAEYLDRWYILDGGHRIQAIREIYEERAGEIDSLVTLEKYKCSNNLDLLRNIYFLIKEDISKDCGGHGHKIYDP